MFSASQYRVVKKPLLLVECNKKVCKELHIDASMVTATFTVQDVHNIFESRIIWEYFYEHMGHNGEVNETIYRRLTSSCEDNTECRKATHKDGEKEMKINIYCTQPVLPIHINLPRLQRKPQEIRYKTYHIGNSSR